MIAISLMGVFTIGIYFFMNPIVDFSHDTENGIKFRRETWGEVVEMAKKEHKLIFLDVYATWCGPCKKLKKNTFADPKVGTFFNSNFINLSLDGEQAEGLALMKKYGLRGFPSLLIIDENGNVIAETGGYQSPDKIIKFGNSALNNEKTLQE